MAAGALAAGVLLAPTAARAAQLPVTTTDDELNADGDCSLREAIEAANSDLAVDACPAGAGADVIDLAGGSTYPLALTGTGEDANATGDLDLLSEVTLQATGTGSAIIDGAGLDRVLHVAAAGTVTLVGVEVTGGLVSPGDGGGILNDGVLTLTDTVVRGNTAEGDDGQLRGGGLGGGIFNAGTLTVTGSAFTSNQALGGNGAAGVFRASGGGGGAGLGGAIFNATGATIVATDTELSANTTRGGTGGGAGNCDPGINVAGNGGGAGGLGGPSSGANGAPGNFAGGGGAGHYSAAGGAGGFGGGGGAAGPFAGGGNNGAVGAGGFGGGNGGSATFSCGGGGGGGAGLGGAIFDDGGSVQLTDVRVQLNVAARGAGGGGHFVGSAGNPGKGWGGALFTNGGAITLSGNSLISDNNETSADTAQADCGTTGSGTITADPTVATAAASGCPATAATPDVPYISTLTVLPIGDAGCSNGGVRVDLGFDDGAGLGVRADGAVTADEIQSTFNVCNGEDGQVGPGGADGAAALLNVTTLPSGDANCAQGGQQIDAGVDNGDGGETADDGVLGAGEIDSTAYVCNGADAVSPLVTVSDEPAGANCASGGQRIDAGMDTDGDGLLDPEEITTRTWVCNGANGADGADGADAAQLLTRTRAMTSGEDLCAPATGFVLEAGRDLDGDGQLSAGEVETSAVLCNGAPGAEGAKGPQGEPGPQGASGCASTGSGPLPAAFLALMLLGLGLRLRRGHGDSAADEV